MRDMSFRFQKSLSDLGCKPPGVRDLVGRTIGTFEYEGYVLHIQKRLIDLGSKPLGVGGLLEKHWEHLNMRDMSFTCRRARVIWAAN
jgi:hypothetical protein